MVHVKRALVCGAGGFIGSHLVRRLRADGYWVRGVDLKKPEFGSTAADDFMVLDLRSEERCSQALQVSARMPCFDEVYQLAADMGGMGFIHSAECEVLRNNALINLNMVHAAAMAGVPRYFFSSSVCVYRDMAADEPALTEDAAYPASPDNEYGWEKLYAERTIAAYARRYRMTVRVGRFQNCYGPEGTWTGGREKAPAAICRKAAEVDPGGTIEVWGDGTAIRSYIYVDDMVTGIRALMDSPVSGPTNIGSREYVSVSELVGLVRELSGKDFQVRYVPGPVGVRSRNFTSDRIHCTGWRPRVSLREGLARTYSWIQARVDAAQRIARPDNEGPSKDELRV
jgi:nucleoside-diphosphate-sugar epimerase